MALLLVILLQTPLLEEAATADLPGGGPFVLTPSRAGKYLGLSDAKSVRVLEAATLKALKELAIETRTVGFDLEDRSLTVVTADAVVRFDAGEWKETARGPLSVEGTAFVAEDGCVYYRSKAGLEVAWFANGKLESKSVEMRRTDGLSDGRVDRIWGLAGDAVVVTSRDEQAVVLRGRQYPLPGAGKAIAAGWIADASRLVVVARTGETLYNPGSFKCIDSRESRNNVAAAVDLKKGRVFVNRDGTLCVWSALAFQTEHVYETVKGGFSQLAVNGEAQMLYAVEGAKLRAWRIKD